MNVRCKCGERRRGRCRLEIGCYQLNKFYLIILFLTPGLSSLVVRVKVKVEKAILNEPVSPWLHRGTRIELHKY
jgi:hypothetical protein